jgi:hypothetical protein
MSRLIWYEGSVSALQCTYQCSASVRAGIMHLACPENQRNRCFYRAGIPLLPPFLSFLFLLHAWPTWSSQTLTFTRPYIHSCYVVSSRRASPNSLGSPALVSHTNESRSRHQIH